MDLITTEKPGCTCLLDAPSPRPAELTARQFLDRLVSALQSPCGDALNLQILVWERAIYVNTYCQDRCSSRERSGQGETVYDAFIALIETCERDKRLTKIKERIADVDSCNPVNLDRLNDRDRALIAYGMEVASAGAK